MILYYGNKKIYLSTNFSPLIAKQGIILYNNPEIAKNIAGTTGFYYSIEISSSPKILDFSDFESIKTVFKDYLDDTWIRDEMELLSKGSGLLENILNYLKGLKKQQFNNILSQYQAYKLPLNNDSFKYIIKDSSIILKIS